MKFKVIVLAMVIVLLNSATIGTNLTLRVDETISSTMFGKNSRDLFYSAENLPNENFTIIVLPDTQYYSEKYPWIFDSQTQWIVDNKETMNIVFVTHVGDIVEHWDVLNEWDNANSSMSRLDDHMRWGILPGNHDDGDFINYNNYFGYDRFSDKSWYGGAYQNINTNNYQLFSVGRDDYLIFHLQYAPSDDILAWANSTIENYPNRSVIVTTHEYIITVWGTNLRSSVGERIWKKFVKPHADQIFLVLCGHSYKETRRTDIVNGHAVHQLLANYQYGTNGGNGWLRILEFCPEHHKIYVKTYSPYLDKYGSDSNSEFTLNINMTDSAVDERLFDPYIVLVSTIIVAIAVTVVFLNTRRNNKS